MDTIESLYNNFDDIKPTPISNIGVEIHSELNKLTGLVRKQPRKKYVDIPRMQTAYYPRPTPQDILIEERDWSLTNTSYSGDYFMNGI